MGYFVDSLRSALSLLWSLDPELIQIVGVSVFVSTVSTILAGTIGIPMGLYFVLGQFRGKRAVAVVMQTLLAIPTVGIGLFVYAVLSRRGILGSLGLLYTKTAVIIGQTILIVPVVAVFTMTAVAKVDERYRLTAMTLGANLRQTSMVVAREARFGLLAAITAAFGRVIAEVGVSMMLGGNVKGITRTMTTAMALEYDKGEFVPALALGIVLLSIAFCVNATLVYFQGKVRR